MTSRNYWISGLVLVVLVLVLALFNFNFIKPILTPKLQRAKALPPGETYILPVDRNIVATTLEKIKSMFPQKKFQKSFEPRRVQRNPFLWPEEMTGRKYGEGQTTAGKMGGETKGIPRLNMIFIGENRKIALINDKLVFEGSRLNGDKVDKIGEKEVLLKSDTGETRLSLSEYTFAPAKKEEVSPPAEAVHKTSAQEETIESLFEKLKPLLKN